MSVAPRPVLSNIDALRQAVDHNILRAAAGKLRFRHDLMREAIYDAAAYF